MLQDITSQMSSFTTGTRYDPLASSVSMSRYGANPYLAGDEDDGVYRIVPQKVPSEASPKVRNHGEGPY